MAKGGQWVRHAGCWLKGIRKAQPAILGLEGQLSSLAATDSNRTAHKSAWLQTILTAQSFETAASLMGSCRLSCRSPMAARRAAHVGVASHVHPACVLAEPAAGSVHDRRHGSVTPPAGTKTTVSALALCVTGAENSAVLYAAASKSPANARPHALQLRPGVRRIVPGSSSLFSLGCAPRAATAADGAHLTPCRCQWATAAAAWRLLSGR